MTLTEFLLARITEDEAVAKATIEDVDPIPWAEGDNADAWGLMGPVDGPSGYASVVVRPERVLAECEAKRRIIAEGNRTPILYLAAVYSDHPDYDEAWRV